MVLPLLLSMCLNIEVAALAKVHREIAPLTLHFITAVVFLETLRESTLLREDYIGDIIF